MIGVSETIYLRVNNTNSSKNLSGRRIYSSDRRIAVRCVDDIVSPGSGFYRGSFSTLYRPEIKDRTDK